MSFLSSPTQIIRLISFLSRRTKLIYLVCLLLIILASIFEVLTIGTLSILTKLFTKESSEFIDYLINIKNISHTEASNRLVFRKKVSKNEDLQINNIMKEDLNFTRNKELFGL